MDFREYAQRVNFEMIDPDEPGYILEVVNTSIPETKNSDLIELCSIPRMSTFAIACLIDKAVREMPEDQCFVNVGVWHGFTLLAGMIGNREKICIGIDNFSEFGGPRAEFRKRFISFRG